MLTKTELSVLGQLSKDNCKIKDIAKALNKSIKQIYRVSKNLEDFITLSSGALMPKKSLHTVSLLHLLDKHPKIIDILSGSGIQILMQLLQPKTVEEIGQETKLKKSMIYKKIGQAYGLSIVAKENKRYLINQKIWPDLKGFIDEYKKFYETTDARIPASSIIYHKDDEEIIFSNKKGLDAKLTAFSVYDKYNIKILLTTNFYCLQKKILSKKDIFLHSVYI
ncbi:MAG: hypothetical protein KJ601_07905, partial [Nanoarchaeota archaeon]|nr:hypothetical protein [Nanoarchaeota archaeon]MBU1703955.1 hypothetical protein [Nanoarchaeota archaeon]